MKVDICKIEDPFEAYWLYAKGETKINQAYGIIGSKPWEPISFFPKYKIEKVLTKEQIKIIDSCFHNDIGRIKRAVRLIQKGKDFFETLEICSITNDPKKDFIIKTCCDYFNVNFECIKNKNRNYKHTITRQLIILFLKKYSKLSNSEIAIIMKRERSTVISSLKNIVIKINQKKEVMKHARKIAMQIEKNQRWI